eukprot:CAMPEP_0172361546 /NCGR_PEP_ID=MMETSP1060-20121228/5360_1 /TAXON_ID=37318 /ORGANISM="Pseudo-nitzschia pungens, Strain cf. cingulata" /LENGTH=699 /DNA_ID=CAMNT_0013083831 /DNA_START=305 /DNA_END=2404 /DNA_ORIENTATION=-
MGKTAAAARGSGRKRAFPTSYRRALKLASAVTLSASFVATVAFQQSIPLSHQHSPLSVYRSPTAIKVLADPTNLVRIEKKQTVEDRAALEELYLLSSLAKKAMVKTNEKRRPRRSSSPAPSSIESTKEIRPATTIAKKKKPRATERKIATVAAVTSTADARSKTLQIKSLKKLTDKANDTRTKSQPKLKDVIVAADSVQKTRLSERVQFRGLSTVPNRRNQRKKRTLDAPDLDRTDLDTDEYIRSLLKKKEEFLSHDFQKGNVSEGVTSEASEASSTDYALESTNTNTFKPRSVHNTMVFNSKSSTMAGFHQRRNTDRQIAYKAGIKKAEGHAGMEFKETSTAKMKRRQTSGQSMYKASKAVPDSLVQFANEIHDVDRITPKEEIMLGEKTQEAVRLQRIYDGLVTKLEREPTDDEWCAAAGKFNMESIAQTIEEGLEAKNRLVTSNLRMVQGVVNVYIKNGLKGQYNAGDLMQEGIVALIRAAEKFDPTKGFRFSTYAMYWIRAAVKRDQLYQSRVIQVPQRLHENSKRIEVCRKELTETLDRPPTVSEISEALGMTKAQIDRCDTAIAQRIVSLDQQIVNKNKPMVTTRGVESLHSIISSQVDDDESEKLDLIHLREDLLKALSSNLTKEEASILTLRFGMDDEYASSKKAGRTISEVGDIMGLKPDKVRRIILRALKKLRISVGEDFEFYNREFSA